MSERGGVYRRINLHEEVAPSVRVEPAGRGDVYARMDGAVAALGRFVNKVAVGIRGQDEGVR